MGYSISWVAFRNTEKAEVLRLLDLADTGTETDTNESLLSGAELPTGWYVVFINRLAHKLSESRTLKPLSKDREVLVCQLEEHVMASSVFCCQSGKKTWDVTHESERGVFDLRLEGSPPPPFESIRQRKIEQQTAEGGEECDVDYIIDVPTDLAFAIVGFMHNRLSYDWGSPNFTRLEPLNA